MSNEKLGSRLPIVVKADSVRKDRYRPCKACDLAPAVQFSDWLPAYVMLSDGERTVRLPVKGAKFAGSEFHVFVEAGE